MGTAPNALDEAPIDAEEEPVTRALLGADEPNTPEMNKLIEEHLPLVKHVVFQVAVHFPRHVEREELARAGALGLVEAARRYDGARGVPFERFAARRIRGAMLDAVRAADWAPRSVRKLARRLESMEQRLATELGRMPSTDETADALGVSDGELRRLRSRVYRSVVLALEQEIDDGGAEDLSLLDVLPDKSRLEPSEELEGRELVAYLHDAIGLLPERHQLVIVGYFLEERTSADLARFLGVTESRISQLRSEALNMLKQGIQAQYGDAAPENESNGRAQARREQFIEDIDSASDWRSRLNDETEVTPRIRAHL